MPATSRAAFTLASVLTIVVADGAPAQAHSDRPETPEVRTAATVTRTVPPDLATITIEFTGVGTTVAEAGSHLASRTDSLRRAFATLGIPPDSVVNRSRWSWWSSRIETVAGPQRWVIGPDTTPDGRAVRHLLQDTTYRIHDALEVRIHDLTRVGAVLDTAMGRRITNISDVKFAASDVTAAQDEALRTASTRARQQADAIAAASNLRLGRTLSLSTDNGAQGRPYGWGMAAGSLALGGSESAPTIISQPAVPVSVTVYGRWELVPK